MGIFGIPSKEEIAIKSILGLENIIKEEINNYHATKRQKNQLSHDDLVEFVEGDLLKTYLGQLSAKDKEAKYFFRKPFIDYVQNSIAKIYNLNDQFELGSKSGSNSNQARTAKGAQESFNSIYDHYQKIKKYQDKINGVVDLTYNPQNEDGGTQRTKGKK